MFIWSFKWFGARGLDSLLKGVIWTGNWVKIDQWLINWRDEQEVPVDVELGLWIILNKSVSIRFEFTHKIKLLRTKKIYVISLTFKVS